MAQLDFFRGERVELIHGMVVRMSPIGPPHCEVVDRLVELLLPALARRARVRSQAPFLAWDDSEPQPDVAVVPVGSYGAQHPDRAHLVIEVADSSLEYDRKTKAPLYAASGVPEYWVVDLVARRIEVHADPKDGVYTTLRTAALGETVSPRAFPDVVVAVTALLT